MSIRKSLFRIWVALTVVSIGVDAASLWLGQHARAMLPGANDYNYITIFLVSAPAPIALAVLLTVLGLLLGLVRWVWNAFRAVRIEPVFGTPSARHFAPPRDLG